MVWTVEDFTKRHRRIIVFHDDKRILGKKCNIAWSGLCRNQIIHQEPRKARKSTKFQTTEYTEYTEKASPPGRQAQKGLFLQNENPIINESNGSGGSAVVKALRATEKRMA